VEEKNMTRFLLLSSFVLFIALSPVAFAQAEASALVIARVENPLSIFNVDGDWGAFAPGGTYVITPGGFKNPPGPSEGGNVVVGPVGFEVAGNAGSHIVVSLNLPSQLISDDGNGGLVTSDWTYGWNYDNDPNRPFAASGSIAGNEVTIGIGGSGVSGLFLGATVTVPPSAFTGSYTGRLVASAAYTGN
jgi:hypothetical protein